MGEFYEFKKHVHFNRYREYENVIKDVNYFKYRWPSIHPSIHPSIFFHMRLSVCMSYICLFYRYDMRVGYGNTKFNDRIYMLKLKRLMKTVLIININ